MSIDLLISTIGTGSLNPATGKTSYRSANYEWKNNDGSIEYFESKLFALVLIELLNPKHTVFLVTDEATKTLEDPEINEKLEKLKKESDTSITTVSIKDGKTIEENWYNFQKIIEVSENHKTIAIDVTHGLRSLQIFGIASAMFISEFKDIEIKHLYYGALDLAKNNNGNAPVLDLKPVLDLYRWMGYARDLMNFGKADELVGELKELQDSLRKNKIEIKTPKQVARSLETFSRTIRLNKTQTLDIVPDLEKRIVEFVAEMDDYHKPFASLLEVLNNRIVKQLNKPTLHEQRLALLKWNIEQGHFYHAISLARELIVSKICIQLCGIDEDRNIRTKAEEYLADIMKSPDCKIASLWSKVTEARNALMHSEFGREDKIQLENVKNACNEAYEYLTQNN